MNFKPKNYNTNIQLYYLLVQYICEMEFYVTSTKVIVTKLRLSILEG